MPPPDHASRASGAPSGDPRLTGLLLAGGASSRMGTDKAVLLVDGVSLAARAASVLAACCERVIVASGDGARLGHLGLPQVADAVPQGGPLAGMVAGLEEADTPLVAVLAVDLPDASSDVLRALAACWDGEVAVIPRVDGRLHPLHAVWSASSAPALAARLARGQGSVTAAAEELGATVVGAEVWGQVDPAGRFARNVNRPEDLEGPIA